MQPTVDAVRSSYLCTGCGVCQGMCPQGAIQMTVSKEGIYSPEVLEEKCNKCGICIKVCSGWEIDYERLGKFVFGARVTSSSSLLGTYLNCYTGHAIRNELRNDGSSGGIVTALLIFALRKGFIDGAIVTTMNSLDVLRPKAILAQSEEELLSSKGSKYCPVPIDDALRNVLKREGRYAVVGLPCQLHSVRKAEMSNSNLKEHLVLHIGLFCSNMANFKGTSCVLERINVNKDDIVSLYYRRNGWPGEMVVRLRDGTIKRIPYKQYWDCLFGNHFFTPWRCFFCVDATSEMADLSVGDPWLPAFKNEKEGNSVVISRTEESDRLLKRAVEEGEIALSKMLSERVEQSQKSTLNSKKRTVGRRMSIFRRFGHTVPSVNPHPTSEGVGSLFSSVLIVTPRFISSHEPFLRLLKYSPFIILNVYFKFLCVVLLATR